MLKLDNKNISLLKICDSTKSYSEVYIRKN